MNNLAHFFGCGIDYPQSSCHSLPLGATYKFKPVWEPEVERFRHKIGKVEI